MVDIKEKLSEGYIHAIVIIEMLGRPKEHIETALKSYMKRISETTDLHVLKEHISETIPKEDMFSTFTELEILFKDFYTLTSFCLDYMPASIEIISPTESVLSDRDLTAFYNDLQGKLHAVDRIAKQLRLENDFLKRNMNSTLHNMILVLLFDKGRDVATISKLTGIPEEGLLPYLENLIKENKIRKEGEHYFTEYGQQIQN